MWKYVGMYWWIQTFMEEAVTSTVTEWNFIGLGGHCYIRKSPTVPFLQKPVQGEGWMLSTRYRLKQTKVTGLISLCYFCCRPHKEFIRRWSLSHVLQVHCLLISATGLWNRWNIFIIFSVLLCTPNSKERGKKVNAIKSLNVHFKVCIGKILFPFLKSFACQWVLSRPLVTGNMNKQGQHRKLWSAFF